DATTGRIGTYQASFAVPNLERESTRLATSSVVLSSQRVPLGDALATARQKLATAAVDPLVQDGQRLVPSVTRVFSRARDLFVFLQAYERGTAADPLVAFVTFYRGDRKAFETEPQAIADRPADASHVVPVRFSIPLAGLSA